MTTLAGNGSAGFAGDEGPATSARLNRPTGVAVHPNGETYFYDFENRRVRRVRNGTITTIARSTRRTRGGEGGPDRIRPFVSAK